MKEFVSFRVSGAWDTLAGCRFLGGRWTRGHWLGSLIVVAWIGWSPHETAQAENFSLRSSFLSKLSAPISSVLDGKPFREGIHSLADVSHVNVWICRNVDPSVRIDAGQLGPTVFAAIRQLAIEHDCVVMPIENVLVIGPQPWVDRLATLVWESGNEKTRIDLQWDALTTPSKAMERITGRTEDLPHDLWPAENLASIRTVLAKQLIKSQFLQGPFLQDSVKPAVKQFQHRYSDLDPPWLPSDLKSLDSKAKIKQTKTVTIVIATPAVHRILLDRWLLSVSPPQISEAATFSLETKVQAGAVLTHLAKTAGWKCLIEQSAAHACQQQVQISAKDQTLRMLIQIVCKNIHVQVQFESDQIRVFKTDR